jgi:hypothetical protein
VDYPAMRSIHAVSALHSGEEARAWRGPVRRSEQSGGGVGGGRATNGNAPGLVGYRSNRKICIQSEDTAVLTPSAARYTTP